MKKLTEYKELDAATFDNSRFFKEDIVCVFKNHINEEWSKPRDLHGVIFDPKFPQRFIDDTGMHQNYATEVITRYPRDVPEGVAELPEDKPFLAYVLEKDHKILKEYYFDEKELYFWDRSKWIITDRYNPYYDHYAINVSTPWAAEKFPEIVEAMEYEPIFWGVKKEYLKGHKLGDKTYDLNWKEINTEFDKEEDKSLKKSEPLEEPPDEDELISNTFFPIFYDQERCVRRLIQAGKARGEWESDQKWKKILKEAGIELK